MMKNSPTSVSVTFEKLLEGIEAQIKAFDEAVDRASKECNYDSGLEMREHTCKLSTFKKNVDTMYEGWKILEEIQIPKDNREEGFCEGCETLEESFAVQTTTEEIPSVEYLPSYTSTRPEKLHTTSKAYRLPILKVLDESGGSAELQDIYEKLELRMECILTEADFVKKGSDIHWQHAVRCEYQSMVKKGLLERYLRGIWKISESGREYLRKARIEGQCD